MILLRVDERARFVVWNLQIEICLYLFMKAKKTLLAGISLLNHVFRKLAFMFIAYLYINLTTFDARLINTCTSGRCNRQSEFTLLHFTIFH